MKVHERTLFQTYFALVWWSESINSKFFESVFFKSMEFSDKFVHKNLQDTGVAQGALLLPSLYVSLLLPKESIFNEHIEAFDEIDRKFSNNLIILENNYNGDVKVTRHIRNAIAHSNINLCGDKIEFSDADKRKNLKIVAQLSLLDLGLLVSDLQKIILSHVEIVKSRGNANFS